MLISKDYMKINNRMHIENPDYGTGGWRFRDEIMKLTGEIGGSILDYGCGKGTLSPEFPELDIREYDPAIPGKDAEPERADLVVCTDVLEHIEPELLDNVLEHLRSLTIKRLFFNIATKPAIKLLPDGTQPHRIIKNADWWKEKLSERFVIINSKTLEHYIMIDAIPLKEVEIIETVSALTDEARNQNVVKNCAKISKRLQDNQPVNDKKAIIVCYGPSLQQTWPQIAMSKTLGHEIITVSGSHAFLLDKGITPDIHIDCDPRERKARQFGKPRDGVKYWMGSCIDPLYLEILEGQDVSLWHVHNGYESEFIWDHEPGCWMLIAGGSIGLCAVSLLYSQGYRDFEIHGMDCSFANEETRHAGPHLSPKPRVLKLFCHGREFVTSASFASYARQFIDDMAMWKDARFTLHGDGLLQEMCRDKQIQEKAA